MGDDGTIEDSSQLLAELDKGDVRPGRSHWVLLSSSTRFAENFPTNTLQGITVLQAVEQLDAGPVWAWEQFPIDIDEPGLTKSSLYRGAITRAAVKAVPFAISRIVKAIDEACDKPATFPSLPAFYADKKYGELSVSEGIHFQGGKTHHRPLLKAAQRVFDPSRHSSVHVSRCIRSADSQPGVLTKIFGPRYYVYGGQVEAGVAECKPLQVGGVAIKGVRDDAVCIETADGKGVWITHLRQPKVGGGALWPKVPALSCLLDDNVISPPDVQALRWANSNEWSPASALAFQQICVKFETDSNHNKVAYIYFDFYNGATSTEQCSRLIEAMDYVISQSTMAEPIRAVALMGSTSYFSNGIALNVIEAAQDPSLESWNNINRIDDVVHHLLHAFPANNILTIAAIRGNAAAGGVALAAACDLVIAGADVILNPAYRAIGLSGSEYHTLSYPGRCSARHAREILRAMAPMTPLEAQRVGLVDYVFPGHGAQLDGYMHAHIALLLQPGCLARGFWKAAVDLSPAALARARAAELAEMARDFWSPRAERYHSRRFDFVRKVKPGRTPGRFAKHRRGEQGLLDEEERDEFDDVSVYRRRQEEEMRMRVRKEMVESATSSAVSTAPTTPGVATEDMEDFLARFEGSKLGEDVKSGEGAVPTLFSCYYQPPKL